MIKLKNIAFMGGIHGVGKTTVCKNLCSEMGFNYISASEVLNWEDPTNKEVLDVSGTQHRLIENLSQTIKNNERYILDGHYCLVNDKQLSEPIPARTFIEINPFCLNILIDDERKIQSRLEKRDNKKYEIEFLAAMQNAELSHAKHLSHSLGIPLNILKTENYMEFSESIKAQMSF